MLRRLIAVLAVMVSLTVGATAHPAYANPAPQQNGAGEFAPVVLGLDGTWACSVPSGYTWDWVQPSSSCGSLRYQYRLRVPVNGLWACAIPAGWTYDSSRSTSVCGISPYQYRLLG